MNTIGFIPKENSVYLYKIVRSDNKNAPITSFKEFALVKAWSSNDNDIIKEGHRYFDYYYNGRIYRKQEVGLSEFFPFTDGKSFNIWSYKRDDAYAIAECKKWLKKITDKAKTDINARAIKLMADRNFGSLLHVVVKDGV